jgi:TPR repeat protein
MAYLGVMYRNGFVVEKDDAKAAEWYQKAIDTGGDTLLTSMAYNNLGILYFNGQGVERNLEKAKELFELAVAKDNNEQAQQHLDEINKKMTSGHTDSNLIEEFARSNNARVLVKRITNREEAVRAFGRLAKAYRVGCHSLDLIGLTCGDLAEKLTSLQENDILLAFNLKSADPLVLDYLKGAVNNFKIVITLSPDPNSQGIEIDLRPFTMVICE